MPQYYRNGRPQFHGNTVTADSIPAVLLLFLVPSPWYYYHVRPHYHGKLADTAVFPQSPLLCSPLSQSSLLKHCVVDVLGLSLCCKVTVQCLKQTKHMIL